MESLSRTIDEAIRSKDYRTLSAVFSPSTNPASNAPSWHAVGQGEKRSLAAHFLQAAVSTPGFLPDAFEHCENVMLTALGHLPATVEDAADNQLRLALFEYKIAYTSEYGAAAQVLAGMRMQDEGVYYVSPVDKLDVYVKIAECFLAEDEIAEADAAVNKAGLVAPLVSTGGALGGDATEEQKQRHKKAVSLLLRYKSTYARVLDANRKFLQAAQRYHELSQQTSLEDVDEDDLLQLLGRAVTCAILAPSGPQRQRVLQHLYQDPRLHRLDEMGVGGGENDFSAHATILSKMYHHQVLRPNELTHFEASLADHQKAVMGDGLTIMERGIVEHNMTAISRLYRTIYVSELAAVLGVTPHKAQKIAAEMILDGTIRGTMDQVEGLLEFDVAESQVAAWDRSIANFCVQLNSVTDAIKQHQEAQQQ